MKAVIAVIALLVATALALDTTEYVMAERAPGRTAEVLNNRLSDKIGLIMRSMDADHDRQISVEDATLSPVALQQHFPGVSAQEFAAFIQTADENKDDKLSREELTAALANGLMDSPEFLEIGAVREAVHRTGVLRHHHMLTVDEQSRATESSEASRAAAPQVDVSQDSCVMCQYLVERMETNVKQAGIIPNMPVGDQPGYETSFLELEAQTEQKDPYDAVGAAVIGSTRQSTRLQRQMERQKYNEIYRVVDITLDDVCEQGMPNAFYGYCKQIYQVQSDIVDGLRYQYRPTDICFRVGMCGKQSYITKGIHSRYKN